MLGPIHLVSYFDAEPLLKKTRELQASGTAFSKISAHRPIPLDWASLDDQDKAWLKEMLCTSAVASYVETAYVWEDGERKPFE